MFISMSLLLFIQQIKHLIIWITKSVDTSIGLGFQNYSINNTFFVNIVFKSLDIEIDFC